MARYDIQVNGSKRSVQADADSPLLTLSPWGPRTVGAYSFVIRGMPVLIQVYMI